MCKFGIEEYMDGVNYVNEMTKNKGTDYCKKITYIRETGILPPRINHVIYITEITKKERLTTAKRIT